MKEIKLKRGIEPGISRLAADTNSNCTCYFCGSCVACLIFIPVVGIVVAATLAGGLIGVQNGG